MATTNKSNIFCDVTRLLLLLKDIQFIDHLSVSFRRETPNMERIVYICLLCLYTLGCWSSCENWTIVDDYSEKYRLLNPYKFHRGYGVQIKGSYSCVENVCASHTK
jgi:hypothetical protein